MYTHVCVYVHMCVCVCVHVCECMCACVFVHVMRACFNATMMQKSGAAPEDPPAVP